MEVRASANEPAGNAAAIRSGPVHNRLDLAAEPSSTGVARRCAADVLRRWRVPADVTDDAVLIVSELITNVIRHAEVVVDGGGERRAELSGEPHTEPWVRPGVPYMPEHQALNESGEGFGSEPKSELMGELRTEPRVGVDAPAAGRPRARTCTLSLWLVPDHLLIAVRDGDPRPPVLRHPADDAERGRGLRLIDEISAAWGYTTLSPQPGKLIWVQLPVTGHPVRPPEFDRGNRPGPRPGVPRLGTADHLAVVGLTPTAGA